MDHVLIEQRNKQKSLILSHANSTEGVLSSSIMFCCQYFDSLGLEPLSLGRGLLFPSCMSEVGDGVGGGVGEELAVIRLHTSKVVKGKLFIGTG